MSMSLSSGKEATVNYLIKHATRVPLTFDNRNDQYLLFHTFENYINAWIAPKVTFKRTVSGFRKKFKLNFGDVYLVSSGSKGKIYYKDSGEMLIPINNFVYKLLLSSEDIP